MVTRNQALFSLMSPALQNCVFHDVNEHITPAARFKDLKSFVTSPVASTLLDTNTTFLLALSQVNLAALKAIDTYRDVDVRQYAVGYVNHVLRGAPHPQAARITIQKAISVRAKIDTAIRNVGKVK
jgi:hypothetical protein